MSRAELSAGRRLSAPTASMIPPGGARLQAAAGAFEMSHRKHRTSDPRPQASCGRWISGRRPHGSRPRRLKSISASTAGSRSGLALRFHPAASLSALPLSPRAPLACRSENTRSIRIASKNRPGPALRSRSVLAGASRLRSIVPAQTCTGAPPGLYQASSDAGPAMTMVLPSRSSIRSEFGPPQPSRIL